MSARQRVATKRSHSRTTTTTTTTNTVDEDDPTSPSNSKRHKTVPEKRLHRYRSTMTAAIRDRIERALHQRLYLLTTNNCANSSVHREYQVLGQTGNVYTVIITHIPSCTCPDHAKGYLCKHIIFVLHRVLKVQRRSPLLYQQALLTDELNEIFGNADQQNQDAHFLAEQSIRKAFQENLQPKRPTLVEQKSLTENDDCPICFESMINDQTKIIFCSTSCGNNMHRSCFYKWQQAKLSIHEPVTCPFCRTEWKNSSENKENQIGSYLNLAAYSTTGEYDHDDDDDEDDYYDFYEHRYYRSRW